MASILITGAGGFLGQALATDLLSDSTIASLTLTDITTPPSPSLKTLTKIHCLQADLTSQPSCKTLLSSQTFTHIYLLHGLMSGAAEANLALGLQVNIDSTRHLLDILRTLTPKVRVIFPSSLAIYGPSGNQIVTESTIPLPGSSYGAEKLICEILLNDFSRRGLIDGRIVRLPTIIVRPGKPSGAASSFCSGIFREPLAGKQAVLPVGRELELWVCSTRTVVRNLIVAKDVEEEKFTGRGSRVVNLPGITVSVKKMLEALREVGGKDAVGLVVEKRDEGVERIVGNWPARFDTSLARELGFVADGDLGRTVREYVEDYGSLTS